MQSPKNPQIKSLEEKVQDMNVKIDNFQRRLEQAPAKISGEFQETIDSLEKRKERLERKMASLKNATGNSFKDLKIGAEMAWEDFKAAYESAKERYEKRAS